MKQAANFRLSKQSLLKLNALVTDLKMTPADIIEQALKHYYERKYEQKFSPLLSLAGSINDADCNQMLDCVRKDKVKHLA